MNPPLLDDTAAFVWRHRYKIIEGLALLVTLAETVTDTGRTEKTVKARVIQPCPKLTQRKPRRKTRR